MVYISGLLEKAQAQAKGGTTYTVKSGDTLSAIGAKYGIDYKTITGYKSGNPNLIYPGEVLTLGGGAAPSAGAGISAPAPQPAPQPAQDINQFLDKYQEQIMASVVQKPETRVRTPEEIKAMVEPSVGLPGVLDYKQMFMGYRDEYGVADLEQVLTGLKAEEDELVAGFRQQRTTERGKPVAMNVISGRIGEEERAYLERQDYITREKSQVTSELTTKYNLIGQLMSFEQQTYQDTVERYENEFNKNIKMYDILRGEERDALSDYERAIDRAKSNLTIFANAVTAGNLSWDSMDDSQKVLVSKLEVQSGMPLGFVSSLQMSAKDRLVSVNEKTGEALMIGEDGGFNVVQTGMTPTPTAPSSTSDVKAVRQSFDDASVASTFPDLVEQFANTMTLEEIYQAYANTEKGKKWGAPIEDPQIIKLTYKVARGEMTEEEAREELGI